MAAGSGGLAVSLVPTVVQGKGFVRMHPEGEAEAAGAGGEGELQAWRKWHACTTTQASKALPPGARKPGHFH